MQPTLNSARNQGESEEPSLLFTQAQDTNKSLVVWRVEFESHPRNRSAEIVVLVSIRCPQPAKITPV